MAKNGGKIASRDAYINRDALMTLLKRYRLSEGLDQEQVAKRVGVSVAAYSAWETGRNLPRAKSVKKLAQVMNLSPMDLTKILIPERHPGE